MPEQNQIFNEINLNKEDVGKSRNLFSKNIIPAKTTVNNQKMQLAKLAKKIGLHRIKGLKVTWEDCQNNNNANVVQEPEKMTNHMNFVTSKNKL